MPNEKVLEDCLRKEADRISNQGSLMNRMVYDSVEPSPLYESIRLKTELSLNNLIPPQE